MRRYRSAMVDLLGLPRPELAAFLDDLGVGRGHVGRVFRGLHAERRSLSDIPDLGRHAGVIAAASHVATVTVDRIVHDADTTTRLALRLADGAVVEAVLVPMPRDRLTLCVSTQVGCAMACAFCATGTLGLTRSMTAGEIVAQVQAADDVARARGQEIRRLVFMGMGEPLHAYDATLGAIRVLTDGGGRGFGSRNVMVSTVGLVDRMRRFAEDTGGRIQLALSLHAGTDATRRRLIPTSKHTDLASLRQALLDHPLPGSRALLLEYVVLPGVNDTDAEVEGLAAFTEGMRALVNLIPWNPFPGAGSTFPGARFSSPTKEQVDDLSARLKARGVPVSVRRPKGRDRAGACGQLALAP